MSDTTARLSLPLIAPSQAQKHVTHNEALRILDGITQLVLAGVEIDTPPENPEAGEVYAIGATPTGAWAGQAGKLAQWSGGWAFITPQEGWRAWDGAAARDLTFRGGVWHASAPDLQNIAGVGINASFDATNALSVAAEATLLSHAGAGHQLKINKAEAGDTASLLYQSGFSGRAEMGLAGTDDFAIKVSPDGASWTEALRVDATTGLLSGAGVQADGSDTAPGRLVTTEGALTAGLSGFGGYYSAAANVDIDAVAAGFAGLVSDANPGTWPQSPDGSLVMIRTRRLDAGQAVKQTAEYGHAASGMPGDLHRYERIRNDTGTQWSGWSADYKGITLLGTVAQTGGIPTGAVIERGTGGSGEYVRFADGTQFCTVRIAMGNITKNGNGTAANPYRTDNIDGNWPAPFAVEPVVSTQAVPPFDNFSIGQSFAIANIRRVTAGSYFDAALLRPAGQSHTAVNFDLTLTAMGRWF